MPRFSIKHASRADVADKTILANTNSPASDPVRKAIYEITVSVAALVPELHADLAGRFDVIRGTVAGAGVAVTATPLDPADPQPAQGALGGTITGQTKTANSAMLSIGIHEMSIVDWYAEDGKAIVLPASSPTWVGLESIVHGGTPVINCVMVWDE